MSPEEAKLRDLVDGGKDARRKETPVEVVGVWLTDFTETGHLGEIDRSVLRLALEGVGADFEPLRDDETRKSLRQPTNKWRANAMRTIWGPKFDEYKEWVNDYVDGYEARTGNKLPVLKKKEGESSGSDTSGMIALLGELTQLAGLVEGQNPAQDVIAERMEARRHNGIMASIGKLEEDGVKVVLSSKEGPKRPGSFPPGFPIEAWEWLTSSQTQGETTT